MMLRSYGTFVVFAYLPFDFDLTFIATLHVISGANLLAAVRGVQSQFAA
jgi:hypothetical protein